MLIYKSIATTYRNPFPSGPLQSRARVVDGYGNRAARVAAEAARVQAAEQPPSQVGRRGRGLELNIASDRVDI